MRSALFAAGASHCDATAGRASARSSPSSPLHAVPASATSASTRAIDRFTQHVSSRARRSMRGAPARCNATRVTSACLVAIALLLGACSSDGASTTPTTAVANPNPAVQALDDAWKAMKDSGASFDGQLRVAGAPATPVNGAWSGDLRTGSGVTTSSVPIGGGAPLDVELRWLDGNAYVRRTVQETGSEQGQLALLVRRSSEKPWAKMPLKGGYVEFFMQAFDPPALLDRLRKQAGGFTVDTDARLHGEPVTHLR